MTTPADIQSGLTIDGVRIPQEIEGQGTAAILAYLADAPVPLVAESAPNPPTLAEGAES